MPSLMKQVEDQIAELGGDDFIFEWIASGQNMEELGRMLGCTRNFLYRWRNRLHFKDTRRPRWEEAMRVRALAKAEEGENILDALAGDRDLTTAKVGLARERATYKRWLASRLDPEAFGDQQSPGVIVNIQGLHLEALKAVNTAHATLPLPAEVVEDDE